MQEGAELPILPRFLLEMDPLSRAVFVFTDVVSCRSVIDLGGDIVVEGIRLPADLRLVFDEILIALVDACGEFFEDLFSASFSRFSRSSLCRTM